MIALNSAVFNGWLFGLSALMCLAWTPALAFGPKPILWGQRIWARIIDWGLRNIVGAEIEIRGRPPEGPALVASKHQSMWETAAFFHLLRDPAYVLKKELLAIPWYGWYCRRAGMIAVDREGGAAALRAMLREARARLAEGRPIVIFPEGSRVAPGETAPHQPGVAGLYRALGVPCAPVALTSGAVWPRRSFIKRPATIIVEFLPPIEPGLAPRAFAERLKTDIDAATARLEAELNARGAPR